MSKYVFLLTAWLVAFCHPVHADERFLPYIEWLTANSDYEYNGEELPTIVTMPYAWLEVEVYGPENVARAEQNNSELPKIKGAYNHEKNEMWFADDVDYWAMEDTIVHELYHFLQHINGTTADCIASLERPAYDIHWRWVEAHGREADFEEPNWLFVFMIEMSCQDHHYYR